MSGIKPTKKIRQTRFPISLFFVLFGVLILMSGVHMGFVVLISDPSFDPLLQTAVPLLYWALVAFGLTLYTKWRMKKSYDGPMRVLANASERVANGDFSVYVPPDHTADKLDYMDILIMDFNKMVEELGSIETLKTDFFSDVSHEIKTPIAIIQNHAELLQRDTLTNEERMEYTKNIMGATRRLSGLITNMLKLNKLEKQAISPLPENYDLCTQLCDCALGFEVQWEEKNIEFVADIEDAATICADKSLMELVWSNLLSNAIKFTQPGGKVTLRQTSDENKITVEVSDNGCGMAEETLVRIFDKFYQGDSSHATEGNGLGLALALRIIQLSDATITARSVLGEGSTFTVTIQAKQEDDFRERN